MQSLKSLSEVAKLAATAILVLTMYCFAVAPLGLLRGHAERRVDYLAGFVGLCWWAFALATLATTL